MNEALLEINGLSTMLATRDGFINPVDQISLRLGSGRALALVGESGSGKSMACASLIGVLPPNGRVVAGSVRFKGRDLLTLKPSALARIRGREIGMVLQDAMTSLNPLLTIGRQLTEVFRRHHDIHDRALLRQRSIEALEAVEIPAAADRLGSYPFQFSGGMRQRVAIAINLACQPDLLICDEPTTALDVTVQLQILNLIRRLQQRRGMAVILVTHDLRLARQFCDDVAVMYAGRIVEQGPVEDVFSAPAHPYTEGLLRSIPDLGKDPERLHAIDGQPPSLRALPAGCRFAPRCGQADDRCSTSYPDWFHWPDSERRSACWQTASRLGLPATGRQAA